MSTLDFPAFVSGDFAAKASYDNESVILHLSGNAESRVMSSIESLLSRLHSEVERLGVHKVTVDFRDLSFMNSSCFKTFVTWLSQVQEAEVAKQYTIHFLSDKHKHWQRRSLNALSCFAADLVRLES